tara:strand:+ start:582 stop:1157 length:576 start_codon:yes stop_codon:yes gene_type:complete
MTTSAVHANGTVATFFSYGLVGAGAFLVAHSCHTVHQTGRVECSRDLTYFHSKWFNLFLVLAFSCVFAAAQSCVNTSGAACGKHATKANLGVVISFTSAIVCTGYAYFAHDVLSNSPVQPVPGQPTCLICTQAKNGLYHTLMWCGVAVAWLGISVVAYSAHAACYKHNRALTERLTSEPNDRAGASDESTA